MDDDDPEVRRLFSYQLRDHVSYQDGRHSRAPSLVFADADFEVGDGNMSLSEDGKRCNEPAIVYVRADSLVDAHTILEGFFGHRGRLISTLQAIRDAYVLRSELFASDEDCAANMHDRAVKALKEIEDL